LGFEGDFDIYFIILKQISNFLIQSRN